MAKNTQHKALASLGHKFNALSEKYTTLRGWYGALRKDHNRLDGDLRTERANSGSLRSALQTARRELSELRQDMHSRHVVSARQFQSVQYELGAANDQVRNLQNRNAALRNKLESAVQGGIIYGALVAIAAYAAGIATQHWFPIAF